jgi:hypothetical protein
MDRYNASPAAPATRVVSSRDYKQQSTIRVDRFFITAKLIPAALPVVAVDGSVHAVLCIFHQVAGGRQTGRQTCRGKLTMSDQERYVVSAKLWNGVCKAKQSKAKPSQTDDVRTELVGFCSHGCSDVRRDLSDAGEGWEDGALLEVVLCGLIS